MPYNYNELLVNSPLLVMWNMDFYRQELAIWQLTTKWQYHS
jgi:hypothetical protein